MQSSRLSDSRRCSHQRVFPPAALPPVPVPDPSQQYHTCGRSTKYIRVCKGKKPGEGCHLAGVWFGWPKQGPVETGLGPDHRHRVKLE